MRYAISLLLSVALLPFPLSPVSAKEKNAAVFFRQSSLIYSDAVPVKLVMDNLKGGTEPQNANHTYTYNSAELGFSWRGWELAHFIREDYIFNYSPDTMMLFYQDKNKKKIPDSERYQVYLDAQHLKAEGWRIGYGWKWDDASQLKISLKYLQTDELLDGSVFGDVAVKKGDINEGALQVMYHYHRDYFLKRKNIQLATGKGYSIDIESDIALGEKWSVQVNLYDLLGQVNWDQAPYTDLSIASTTTYYDEKGYAHRDPMMQGMEGYKNYTQDLPVHYQVSLRRQIIGGLDAVYTREKYDEVGFDRLFLRYEIMNRVFLVGGYDFTMEASWFGIDSNVFSLNVAMDDWSFVDSKSLVIRMQGRWDF